MRDDQVSDARNEHDGRAEREVLSTIGEERQLNDDRQAQHTLTTCCHTTVRKIKTKKDARPIRTQAAQDGRDEERGDAAVLVTAFGKMENQHHLRDHHGVGQIRDNDPDRSQETPFNSASLLGDFIGSITRNCRCWSISELWRCRLRWPRPSKYDRPWPQVGPRPF